jgi:HEAT repeat protein
MSEFPSSVAGIPPPGLSPRAVSAAHWLRDLSRTAKTTRLYATSNATVEEARAEFARATLSQVEEAGGWTLQILPEEILLDEELIVHPPRRGPTRGETAQRLISELPFRLYRDGVRELTVLPGIPRRDVDALVDALALAWTERNRADDFVTALWQANPTHVRVVSAPPEQLLYASTGAGVPHESERGLGLSLGLPPVASDIRAELGDRGGPIGLQRETGLEESPVAGYFSAQRAYESLRPEGPAAQLRFLESWGHESSRLWWDEARDVFVLLMKLDPSEETRAVLVRFAITGVTHGIDCRRWTESAELLHLVRWLDPDGIWTADPLREAVAQHSDPELGESLDESTTDDLNAFLRLTMALEEPGIPLALAALGSVKSGRARAAASAALTYLCARNPHVLAPALDDRRPEFVRAIVTVLGHIGGSSVASMCSLAAHHPDPDVTREVSSVLPALPEPERTQLLLELLLSRDPQTLLVALKSARRDRNPEAARAIVRMIEGAGFDERPEEVRRALFQALVEVGDASVIPALESQLTQGGWFARPNWRRFAAAQTLARMGLPEAAAALERGRRHSAEAVRAACREKAA